MDVSQDERLAAEGTTGLILSAANRRKRID
jgi:hypothetical protein